MSSRTYQTGTAHEYHIEQGGRVESLREPDTKAVKQRDNELIGDLPRPVVTEATLAVALNDSYTLHQARRAVAKLNFNFKKMGFQCL